MAGDRCRDAGPLLVAIEGIDGSGKTTLAAAMTADLAGRGIRVTGHREPGDGPRCCRPLTAIISRHG